MLIVVGYITMFRSKQWWRGFRLDLVDTPPSNQCRARFLGGKIVSSSWNLVGFVNIYICSRRQPVGRLEIKKNIKIPSRGYNTKDLLEAKGRFKKDQEA